MSKAHVPARERVCLPVGQCLVCGMAWAAAERAKFVAEGEAQELGGEFRAQNHWVDSALAGTYRQIQVNTGALDKWQVDISFSCKIPTSHRAGPEPKLRRIRWHY